MPVKRLLLSLAFGLVVAGLLVALTGADRFLAAVERFPAATLAAVAGLSLLNYLLRFLKWHYFLGLVDVDCPPGLSARTFTAGMLMSVTPGKFGEVFKSLLLKSELGTPVSRTAPVVVAERLTDLVAVIALCFTGFSLHGESAPAIAVGLLAFASALVGVTRPEVYDLAARLLPPHAARIRALHASMRKLLRPVPILFATLLSVLSWFMECLGFWWIGRLVAPGLALPDATYVYAVSTLAGALSMLPGGLAATEGGLAYLLVRRGALLPDAGAATFLIRLLTLWLAVGLGLVVFFAGFDGRKVLAAAGGETNKKNVG